LTCLLLLAHSLVAFFSRLLRFAPCWLPTFFALENKDLCDHCHLLGEGPFFSFSGFFLDLPVCDEQGMIIKTPMFVAASFATFRRAHDIACSSFRHCLETGRTPRVQVSRRLLPCQGWEVYRSRKPSFLPFMLLLRNQAQRR